MSFRKDRTLEFWCAFTAQNVLTELSINSILCFFSCYLGLLYITLRYYPSIRAVRLLFVAKVRMNHSHPRPRPTKWHCLTTVSTTRCIIRYLARPEAFTLVLLKTFYLPIPFAVRDTHRADVKFSFTVRSFALNSLLVTAMSLVRGSFRLGNMRLLRIRVLSYFHHKRFYYMRKIYRSYVIYFFQDLFKFAISENKLIVNKTWLILGFTLIM